MRNEFTAIIEQDQGWFIAFSPEIPGANGQGRTKDEAIESLRQAIELILLDRREDGLRGVPPEAIRETVVVGCDIPNILARKICRGLSVPPPGQLN